MRLLAGAVICAIAFTPAPAAAWSEATHRRIIADAAALLPQPMRDRLGLLAEREQGTVYPDSIPSDVIHHYYCLDGSYGDAPATVAGLYREMLKDSRPAGLLDFLAALPAALLPAGCSSRAEDGATDPLHDGSLAFRIGAIAHYLADVNVPFHTVSPNSQVQLGHGSFETWFEERLAGVAPVGDGRLEDIGGDPAAAVIGCARAANGELAIVIDPTIDHASARYRESADRGYSRAVNAVADLWYSLLLRIPAP